MKAIKTINAIIKSKSLENNAARGSMRRGKYTLLIMDELLIKLAEASLRAAEKYVQASSPHKLNNEYGMPSELILAKFPKTTVKMSMVKSGWITAQPTPNMD